MVVVAGSGEVVGAGVVAAAAAADDIAEPIAVPASPVPPFPYPIVRQKVRTYKIK